MIFVQEDTSCVRRTHLEPGSIPEDRSKVLFHFFSVLYFSRCRNQVHFLLLAVRKWLLRPVYRWYIRFLVSSSTCAGYTQKSQSLTASLPSIRTSRFSFCGVSIPLQAHIHTAQWTKIPNRNRLSADSSMSIYFSEFILDGIYCFCSLQRELLRNGTLRCRHGMFHRWHIQI